LHQLVSTEALIKSDNNTTSPQENAHAMCRPRANERENGKSKQVESQHNIIIKQEKKKQLLAQ
jgi:hypothetical protein